MDDDAVRYEVRGEVALVTMNRPQYRNAQNGAITYGIDAAFVRAVEDDAVKVIVLAGAGEHFSSGHDIGTPERDAHVAYPRHASIWWDHTTHDGADARVAREQEVYLGMCRRWRAIPKPTIAMVQGACIAGGLMLAWACDLIVAADDAYFAHPWVMGPRFAKEFLFLGEPVGAHEARALGMVNRVVPRARLEPETFDMAARIARMPAFGLALTKKAVNQCEDLMGLHSGMDAVFGLHHLAHSHNAEVMGDSLAGMDARRMRDAARTEGGA
jgi:enoyl-CoA hydratase